MEIEMTAEDAKDLAQKRRQAATSVFDPEVDPVRIPYLKRYARGLIREGLGRHLPSVDDVVIEAKSRFAEALDEYARHLKRALALEAEAERLEALEKETE